MRNHSLHTNQRWNQLRSKIWSHDFEIELRQSDSIQILIEIQNHRTYNLDWIVADTDSYQVLPTNPLHKSTDHQSNFHHTTIVKKKKNLRYREVVATGKRELLEIFTSYNSFCDMVRKASTKSESAHNTLNLNPLWSCCYTKETTT
jgi:hypothetical protein